MKCIIKAALIVINLSLLTGCQSAQSISFIEKPNQIDVMIDDKLFTTYNYADDLTKPALFPVLTPSGIRVNRNHPPAEGESTDHLHHTGIFFTYDQVNGVGYWNNKTTPPQVKHIKTVACGNQLRSILHWTDTTGKVVLEEQRTMAFVPGQNENAIDFQIRLVAQDQPVVFEDTKEGMFAIRVAAWLKEKGGTGQYLSSEGAQTEKNVWGERARWVRLQGQKDNKTAGVAIFNHPGSVNYPTYWHARAYGLFAANPLGQYAFQQSKKVDAPQKLNLTLNPHQSANFRYLMLIYDGDRSPAQLESRFNTFEKTGSHPKKWATFSGY